MGDEEIQILILYSCSVSSKNNIHAGKSKTKIKIINFKAQDIAGH